MIFTKFLCFLASNDFIWGTAVFQNGTPPPALFEPSRRFWTWLVLISSCITSPLVMERFVFFMERFSVGHGTCRRLTASFSELTASHSNLTASFCKSTASFSNPTASNFSQFHSSFGLSGGILKCFIAASAMRLNTGPAELPP